MQSDFGSKNVINVSSATVVRRGGIPGANASGEIRIGTPRTTGTRAMPRATGLSTEIAAGAAPTRSLNWGGFKAGAKKVGRGLGRVMKVAAPIATGAFIAAPLFTEKRLEDKIGGSIVSAAEMAGFAYGGSSAFAAKLGVTASRVAKIGMAGQIGMGAVKIAGGFGVAAIFSAAAEYGVKTWTGGVKKEMALRKLNWAGDTSAFNTQKAHTMRQTSLQAMNRGMMSARSMMGREAMVLHQ